MVAMEQQCDTRDRVGKYEFETTFSEGGEEDVQCLRSRRRRALTNWLLSEWKREQKEVHRA